MGLFSSIGGAFSNLGSGLATAIGAGNPLTLGLGALTSFGSSALNYISAEKQNDSAETQAKNSMAFSADQARQQMDFQERMSSTAHQREVKDLVAAGLNPILSANSGASTPSGASGSGAQAPVVPELSNISSSVMDAMRMWNDFSVSKAQRDNLRANTVKTGVDTSLLKAKGPEAQLDSRVYSFINGLLDRFGSSSAKSSVDVIPPENIRLVPRGSVEDGSYNRSYIGN